MRVVTSNSFTVKGANLDASKSYSIQVSTSNSNLGFNSGCTDRQENATVPAGDTSHTSTLTLRACSTGGGIVTATLLHDGASVDTDTHSITVTTTSRPPPPRTPGIDISGLVNTMDMGDNDSFTVTASNLVSSASYTIDISTDDTGIGFDSNCTNREEEVTVQSKTLHAVYLTLYGCATAGGTVTATLSRDGSTVDTDTHSLTVTTPPTPHTRTIRISELVSTMDRGTDDAFTVVASNLDSSASYTIDVSTNDTGIGFDSSCPDRDETDTAQNTSSHTVSLTLYGCATGGGTVTATLSRDGSTVDTATQTVTVVPPGISIKISDLVRSLVEGETDRFEVTAENLEASESYKILLTSSNGAVGFQGGCWLDRYERSVPANRTSYSISHTLKACATPGDTVKATLLSDDNEVISATQYVTVRPDLSPKIAMWGFFGIYKVGAWHSPFTVTASYLDSTKSYVIKLTITDEDPDRIAISFDSGCTVQEKPLTVPADSTSYTGRVRLQGCDAMGATVNANLLLLADAEDTNGTNIASDTHNLSVGAHGWISIYQDDTTNELRAIVAGLDSTKTYRLKVEATTENTGFNQDCSQTEKTLATLTGKPSYSTGSLESPGVIPGVTLYGCGAKNKGSVTAKLFRVVAGEDVWYRSGFIKATVTR